MKNTGAFCCIIGLLLAASLACNMPGLRPPEVQDPGYIYTAAAQTLEAQRTQVSRPPATGGAAIPVTGETPAAPALTPAGPAATTPAPQVSPTGTACNQASFVRDITYPDDSFVQPRQTFVKVWRLRNSGSCTWDAGYQAFFSGGDRLTGAETFALTPGSVPPGETIDVQIALTAPANAGIFRAEFKLRDAAGEVFGLGANNRPFWAQVRVAAGEDTSLDFIALASSAEWASGVANSSGAPLEFGGADDNPAGVAEIKDGILLESGLSSGKILLTHPQRAQNGFVAGVFPAYSVEPGDRFEARLGFWTPNTRCHAGQVRFQLNYLADGQLRPLREWRKGCDGSLLPVTVDLGDLEGQTVQFVLVVTAEGSPTDDWAVWNSALIEN